MKLKWIIFFIGVLAFEALFLGLANWQYTRMNEKVADKEAFMASLEDRKATFQGVYDYKREVVLESQKYGNMYGYRILTPLVMGDTEVIVDRGWIQRSYEPGFLSKYHNTDTNKVTGILREPPERKQTMFKGSDYGKGAATILNVLDLSLIPTLQGVARMPMYLQATTQTDPKVKAFFAEPEGGDKHKEYMFTWLALAILLPLLSLFLFWKRKREDEPVQAE